MTIKLKTLFFLIGYGFSVSNAQDFDIEMNSGLSLSTFSWSIAGDINGMNPTVLSKLKWEKMHGFNNAISIKSLKDKFPVKASALYEKYFNGEVNDIDYARDNSGEIVNKISFNSNRGYFIELQGLYRIVNKYKVSIGPQILFQHLTLEHSLGESRYDSKWYGLKIEKEGTFKICQALITKYMTSVSALQYNASADWVLRKNLMHPISFEHMAIDFFIEARIEFLYSYGRLRYGLGSNMRVNKSLIGSDYLFYSDGTKAVTRLNGVNGIKNMIYLSMSRKF